MNILNNAELEATSGGNGGLVVLGSLAAVGAVIKFSYEVGVAMAERDNEMSCPAPDGP
jgi:hypothetical protein